MIPDVCSIQEQSSTSSNKEQFYDGCLNEQSNITCTRNTGDKNCQAHKSDTQPVKPKMDMWSMQIPAKMQSSYKRKDQVTFNQGSMKDDL